ncbi:uncharacterized protein CCOS01_06215 [Colletotrichum costaricense]|uniref:Uncharacterized protein n=1 Tax=Colletotrichum costaricense TaxID=1209916 RepID=A0AAI9YYY7_9PEZI|nr:uncharacterized protein CCOS01_06215 [Colletotrichum costaricense]KAK1528381.1 hypothetical protein CCOS01_06215 [Colletotrichum costaricense]
MIREYPSKISEAGPSTTMRDSLFTYPVGVKLLSSLINEVVLRALKSSVVAMAESMLAAYGAAQLIVGNFFEQRGANETIEEFVIREKVYLVAIAVFNALVILAVVREALITASFRGSVLSKYSEADGEGRVVPKGFQKGPHFCYSPVAESEKNEERYISIVSYSHHMGIDARE